MASQNSARSGEGEGGRSRVLVPDASRQEAEANNIYCFFEECGGLKTFLARRHPPSFDTLAFVENVVQASWIQDMFV